MATQATLPTEMTIGGRTYEILGLYKEEDEGAVSGPMMTNRAREMNAHLGQDDGQHILDHQGEILTTLRRKVVFVFTDWRDPVYPGRVACVACDCHHWVRRWRWLDDGFDGRARVLRRK